MQGGTIRYNVDLYRVDFTTQGRFLERICTLPDKTLSHVLWAQNGIFFALVNTDKMSANIGFLEFGFIKNNNTVEITGQQKYPYMVDAQWDPSGRCLATISEKGHYQIWTAYGDSLFKDKLTNLSQVNNYL